VLIWDIFLLNFLILLPLLLIISSSVKQTNNKQTKGVLIDVNISTREDRHEYFTSDYIQRGMNVDLNYVIINVLETVT
ncbi:uncharacterized protein V6R79_025754, partial [Siganus canaliculatus]